MDAWSALSRGLEFNMFFPGHPVGCFHCSTFLGEVGARGAKGGEGEGKGGEGGRGGGNPLYPSLASHRSPLGVLLGVRAIFAARPT